MEDNVFEKLKNAATNGTGVTLTYSEVWLLDELAGEELAKASDKFELMREFIEDYEREKNREAAADLGVNI